MSWLISRLCPVIHLWQRSFLIRPRSDQPKLIYRVWKNSLYKAPVFAMLIVASPALAQIPNPIAAQSFLDLINAVAKAITQIGAVFAVVAIIIVGFRFVAASASGDTKSLAEVKKLFWWIFIGTAIIVGSSMLAQAVVNTIKTLGK